MEVALLVEFTVLEVDELYDPPLAWSVLEYSAFKDYFYLFCLKLSPDMGGGVLEVNCPCPIGLALVANELPEGFVLEREASKPRVCPFFGGGEAFHSVLSKTENTRMRLLNPTTTPMQAIDLAFFGGDGQM